MEHDHATSRCSACGAEGRREDMFGPQTDLLCARCAHQERERMRPTAVGKTVSPLGSGRSPLTILVLGIAAVLFVLSKGWQSNPAAWPAWIQALTLVEILPAPQPGYVYVLPMVVEEPWRLLTSAFLHIGVIHILFNAWWIWDLGRGIEFHRGSVALGLLVVGSAIAASAIQWIFSGSGVGLSGVVYGLAAFLFTQRKRDPLAAALMNPNTTRLLLAWLVIGVILSETGAMNIGNWAHGGGMLWGLAAGLAWTHRLRWVFTPLLALATIALVVLVMQGVRV